MNKLFLLYFMLLSVVFSCGDTGKLDKTLKSVKNSERCVSDAGNTYEVYIPARSSALNKLPLLVILDPHGSGKSALDKFRQGSKHYPVVLAASNLVKNGFANYENAIQTLVNDVRKKYPVNETIFLSGFSGGARMALGYALKHQINGLILCGALANPDQINAVRCPIISISGMDDFNFMETAQYLFDEQVIPKNLKIELTNASHNWPESTIISNALGFLYLSSPAADILPTKDLLLSEYYQNQQARIDSLKKQSDFLNATLVARNMSTTTPFSSNKFFTSSYDDLKTNPKYANQLNLLKNSLQHEINMRQPYLKALVEKDSLWWKNEILTLNKNIEVEQDTYKNNMYRRIKGFLGIACYSLGNRSVKERNASNLKKIVSVYKMLEPENPYVYYLASFHYFWKSNYETSISILKKAHEMGFSDINQLKKDFPESIISKLN